MRVYSEVVAWPSVGFKRFLSLSLGSWLDLVMLPFMFITVARDEEY